jgi:hypothetical protein
MKSKSKARLGLIGFALFAIANFGLLASHAQAADYSGTCANVPTGAQTGNATIGSAGAACSLPANVNFSGNVTILGSTITSSGPINAGQALTLTGTSTIGVAALNGASVKVQTTGVITLTAANASAGYVDVVANGGSGDINATSLTAANGYIKAVAGRKVNISGALATSGTIGARNILITAQTTIKTGNLTAASNANIVVKSQKGGGTTALTVGTSGTNGIGTVTAGANGTVYIVNGTSGANANITLTAMNKIVTTAGGNYIILDARGGTLTMPSGTLSTPHSSGQASIQLMAKTVTFSGAATLQANNAGAAGTLHGVTISANTINHNGLTINADGPGANPAEAYVYFQAMGTTVITDNNENVTNLYVFVNNTNPNTVTGPVSIVSSGGLLKATANGNNARIKVDAYPITITGGPVTFQTNGIYGREIQISNQSQNSGTQGVTFSGGDVLLDASASANGYGGSINFWNIDKLAISSPNFTIKSDGAVSGSGDAGFISIYTYSYSQASSSKAKISANGPVAGSGNGGYIYFYPNLLSNTLKLGTNNGDLQVTADAGANGGDGGSITINPNYPNGNINFDTVNAVSAKSSSLATANSKGGSVTIIANPEISVNPSTPAIDINVNGKGTKDGGTITILANGTLKIGSQAGALNLSAKAAGTGNGGGVEIGYITNLTLSDTLSVVGGTGSGSNGDGGNINIHDSGTILIGATIFDASGSGSGDAGTITVNAAVPVDLSNGAKFIALGGESGAGGKAILRSAKFGSNNQAIPLSTIFSLNAGETASADAFNGSISLNLDADQVPIICRNYKNVNTSWPKVYWYCGNDIANKGTLVLSTLQTMPNASISAMPSSEPFDVFVFHYKNDYSAFFATFQTDNENGLAGWTSFANRQIVILEVLTSGNVNLIMADSTVKQVTMHEVGHVLDVQFGSVLGRSFVSQIGGTQQSSFNGFLSHDFRNLTFQGPSYTVLLPACGAGAIFEGKSDPRTGGAICPLSGDLTGLNNQQILQKILPYFMTYDSAGPGTNWGETWSEQFGAFTLNVNSNPQTSYFLAYFPCTKIFVTSLANTGSAAPLGSYPTACIN